MEHGKLKYIPDRASLPLLVTGSLLTAAGVLTLVAFAGLLLGILPPREPMQPAGALVSMAMSLVTGLPALLAFFLRKKRYAAKLGRVAGGLLLIYAAFFPFALLAGAPFVIPLILYFFGATGIWALLKSKP